MMRRIQLSDEVKSALKSDDFLDFEVEIKGLKYILYVKNSI